MVNDNDLIYKNELVNGVCEWVYEQTQFLKYLEFHEEICQTRYQPNPDAVAAAVDFGVQGVINGLAALQTVTGTEVLGNDVLDQTGNKLVTLTRYGVEEFNRYETIQEKRAFLKKLLKATQLYDLIGMNLANIEPDVSVFADKNYMYYQEIVDSTVTGQENGLEILVSLHLASIKKYLLEQATGNLIERLIQASVPPEGDSLYKTTIYGVPIKRRIILEVDGEEVENATLEGALCRAAVWNETPGGAQVHHRTGMRRPYFVEKSRNRSEKYPLLHVPIDEDIINLPNGDLFGDYEQQFLSAQSSLGELVQQPDGP